MDGHGEAACCGAGFLRGSWRELRVRRRRWSWQSVDCWRERQRHGVQSLHARVRAAPAVMVQPMRQEQGGQGAGGLGGWRDGALQTCDVRGAYGQLLVLGMKRRDGASCACVCRSGSDNRSALPEMALGSVCLCMRVSSVAVACDV